MGRAFAVRRPDSGDGDFGLVCAAIGRMIGGR
jgi:hypothetical protein